MIRLFDRTLGRVAKRHRDGTHRAVAPASTIARFRRLMKTCGITRLANLTGLDTLGVPVWSAIRPNGRSLSTSQGKGLTDEHARASALMESLETWHAENIALPRHRSPGSARVDVRGLARVRPLPRGASFEWVEGWDLVSSSAIWVPYEAVTLDTVFAAPPVFDVSSNGLASGNHILEAIVHGLTEVIERDAEAAWRAEKGDRRVDLSSVTGPAAALLARLRAHGVFVAIWDLTSDVGIPVYGCAILEDPREPAWRALGLYQGFGCHLDPEVAVIRAVTEAVQTRVTYIAGSRDDFFPFDYDRATDEEILHGIWADLTRPRRRWVDLRRAPRLARETFDDDLRVVVDHLVAAGCSRAVVVDLTRAELGVPVVKCLVPGRAKRVHLMG